MSTAATEVQGSLTLAGITYKSELDALHSLPEDIASETTFVSRISILTSLEEELYQFGVPGLFHVALLSLVNRYVGLSQEQVTSWQTLLFHIWK